MTGGRPARVATVITRLEGGAGQHALRGARAMDPARYTMTIITGHGELLAEAETAGLEVIVEPSLRANIAPGSDVRALARLTALLRRGPDGGHRPGPARHPVRRAGPAQCPGGGLLRWVCRCLGRT